MKKRKISWITSLFEFIIKYIFFFISFIFKNRDHSIYHRRTTAQVGFFIFTVFFKFFQQVSNSSNFSRPVALFRRSGKTHFKFESREFFFQFSKLFYHILIFSCSCTKVESCFSVYSFFCHISQYTHNRSHSGTNSYKNHFSIVVSILKISKRSYYSERVSYFEIVMYICSTNTTCISDKKFYSIFRTWRSCN